MMKQFIQRLAKFSAVGAIGIAVQVAVLWALTRIGIAYLLATAIAVEAAVLHLLEALLVE